MSTTTLNVKGMRCAGCVSSVEKGLLKVEGVNEASVNLATGEAQVDHANVETDKLVEAVKEAGYEASPASDDDEEGESGGSEDYDLAPMQLAIAGGVALVILILGMSTHATWSKWTQLVLATPLQVWLGLPFYRGAWKAARRFRADMDSLVAMGTTAAFGYSLIVTLLFIDQPVYFDTAVMILVLIGLGKLLEHRARRSAGDAIRNLMDLQPAEATVERDGERQTIAVRDVQPGDRVIVKPGERVPVDGKVVEGESSIDTSMVTGESLPREVGEGDRVIGGTINQEGSFTFEATQTGKETVLSQVIKMVKEAQSSKARIQRLVDKVAGVFVPVVIGVAMVTLAGWAIAGYGMYGFIASIAVLIVACPCALGLATPTAIMVGTGLGASRGILIKNAGVLERAGKLTHIILDKTGTLTVGRVSVSDFDVFEEAGIDEDEALQLAASVEGNSEHPLAKAVVKHAEGRDIELKKLTNFSSITAGGVKGEVDGRKVIVGRFSTLRDEGVEGLDEIKEKWDGYFEGARTAVLVAIDSKPVAAITFDDSIREEAGEVVKKLHNEGLKVTMMTGDAESVAKRVAERLGIDDVMAEVMPDDKQGKVQSLRDEGAVVAMVGDGINDAPALAASDLGIAMGGSENEKGGTDIAMDSADVVLVGSDLQALPRAIDLSRSTMRTIWTGLGWAFIYNTALIPLAAVGIMHPMFAAAAMSLSSVSVVGNALWLKVSWKG